MPTIVESSEIYADSITDVDASNVTVDGDFIVDAETVGKGKAHTHTFPEPFYLDKLDPEIMTGGVSPGTR